MAVLAVRGVDLPTAPNGPVIRMVDQEIVRSEFYAQTPSDGTPEQKAWLQRKQFNRIRDWAEAQQLIGIREIGNQTYFWLTRPEPTQQDI